jgi:hypothetical protein
VISGRPGQRFIKDLVGQVFERICADSGHGCVH